MSDWGFVLDALTLSCHVVTNVSSHERPEKPISRQHQRSFRAQMSHFVVNLMKHPTLVPFWKYKLLSDLHVCIMYPPYKEPILGNQQFVSVSQKYKILSMSI